MCNFLKFSSFLFEKAIRDIVSIINTSIMQKSSNCFQFFLIVGNLDPDFVLPDSPTLPVAFIL